MKTFPLLREREEDLEKDHGGFKSHQKTEETLAF